MGSNRSSHPAAEPGPRRRPFSNALWIIICDFNTFWPFLNVIYLQRLLYTIIYCQLQIITAVAPLASSGPVHERCFPNVASKKEHEPVSDHDRTHSWARAEANRTFFSSKSLVPQEAPLKGGIRKHRDNFGND